MDREKASTNAITDSMTAMDDYLIGCGDVILDDAASHQGEASSSSSSSYSGSDDDNDDQASDDDDVSFLRTLTTAASGSGGGSTVNNSVDPAYSIVDVSASDIDSAAGSEVSLYGSVMFGSAQRRQEGYPRTSGSLIARAPHVPRSVSPALAKTATQTVKPEPTADLGHRNVDATPRARRPPPPSSQVCPTPMANTPALPRALAFRRRMKATEEMRTLREVHMAEVLATTTTTTTNSNNNSSSRNSHDTGRADSHDMGPAKSKSPSPPPPVEKPERTSSPASLDYSSGSFAGDSPASLSWGFTGDHTFSNDHAPPVRPATPRSPSRSTPRTTSVAVAGRETQRLPTSSSRTPAVRRIEPAAAAAAVPVAMVVVAPSNSASSTNTAEDSTSAGTARLGGSVTDIWEAAVLSSAPSDLSAETRARSVAHATAPPTASPTRRATPRLLPTPPSPSTNSVSSFPRHAPAQVSPPTPAFTAPSSSTASPPTARSAPVLVHDDGECREVSPSGPFGGVRPRSATAPDVSGAVMQLVSRRTSSSSAGGESNGGGGGTRSRPQSAGRRSGGIRFLKARKAPDPFAASTAESVERGRKSSLPLLHRSPLAPLLRPTTITTTTHATAGSSPLMGSRTSSYVVDDGDVRPARTSFRDRITTQEERHTARAQQLSETATKASESAVRSQASSASEGDSNYSVGSLLNYDSCYDGYESDGPWNAPVANPAPLTFPGRLGSSSDVSGGDGSRQPTRPRRGGRKTSAGSGGPHRSKSTTSTTTTTTTTTNVASDGERDDGVASEFASMPELVPPLKLADGAYDPSCGPASVTSPPPAVSSWKTLASENGEARVVYAGECILPQVLRDHQARQYGLQLPSVFAAVEDAATPSTTAIVGNPPSPLRRLSQPNPSVQHWSPVAPVPSSSRNSTRGSRTTAAAQSSTTWPTTASTQGPVVSSTTTADTASTETTSTDGAPSTVVTRLPSHIEHIFSLSSSLAHGERSHSVTPPHHDQDDMENVVKPYTGRPREPSKPANRAVVPAPVSTTPTLATTTSGRWENVPVPALTTPTKANYVQIRNGEKASM